MPGSWEISEEAAAERERKVLDDLRDVRRRFFVPGMPLDHVRFRLAAYGYTIADLRRALAYAERHGHG